MGQLFWCSTTVPVSQASRSRSAGAPTGLPSRDPCRRASSCRVAQVRHPWSEGRTGGARDIGENSRVLWLLSAASRVIRVTEAGQKYFFWGQWEATGEDGCVFSFAAAVSRASCRPSGRARPDTFFRGVDELWCAQPTLPGSFRGPSRLGEAKFAYRS